MTLTRFIASAFMGLCYANSLFAMPAANVKINTDRDENTHIRETLVLPYAFSTDDMGLVLGVGAMATGVHQKQMSVGGTYFGGEASQGLALGVWDYRLFDSERLFITAMAMVGHYPLMRAYSSEAGEATPPGEARPGDNDSDFDDFFAAKGTNNWWDVKLEYVLPIGDGKKSGMKTYHLERGLVENNPGISHWNPFTSGTTVFLTRQFNRYQNYETDDEHISGAVHALELGVLYDNTDFPMNPSEGSRQYLAYTYNPPWLESTTDWNFIEFEASKYFSLGENAIARQNIIAMNMWMAYSPSWQVTTDEQGNSYVDHNPPFIEGATLGGMYRMRGFRQNRFHDKAAIYTTAEYRMTLDYNPIEDIRWLKFVKLDWFQLVLFAEGGRVAPSYAKKVIFKDWKTDYGASLRALTAGIVVRLDVTTSEEGTGVWAMVEHPF